MGVAEPNAGDQEVAPPRSRGRSPYTALTASLVQL